MRNIMQHPVTRDEIVECLKSEASKATDEMLIGDMRPLLLGLAAQIVNQERDNKKQYTVEDLAT